ncbi:MAG: alpha/beta hydrolase [Micrococcales bacterium]|nr:alpha/beta hydrolase [Micrococcales bacterium]
MVAAVELQELAASRAINKSAMVDGALCNYWFYPSTSENPEQDPTIVLVHGYRGDHHGLESFAGGLAKFNIIAPDLPGFGSSTPLAQEHNLDNYVIWLAAFVRELQLDQPIAVGHSFGTLMITAAQARYQMFRALVCINPVAGGITKGISRILLNFVKFYYFAANKMPTSIGLKMLTTNLLVDGMSAYTTKSEDKSLRDWIKAQHKLHFNSFANSDVIWECYLASISNVIQPYVKDITVPVLMIAAELDEVTPVSEVFKVAETMKSAQVHVIPNCGHLVHYEAAQQTVDYIEEFLNRVQLK